MAEVETAGGGAAAGSGPGCGPIVAFVGGGVMVGLLVIFIALSITLDDDEDTTGATDETTPGTESVATTDGDEEAAPGGPGTSLPPEGDGGGPVDVYAVTFPYSSAACEANDLSGLNNVPPAELRVSGENVEIWLPHMPGSGGPVGELYLSGTASLDGDDFVYQIDPTISAVSLKGTFKGDTVTGTYYLTVTETGENSPDPCYQHPFEGTLTGSE
jgi:hypothetical protein